MSYPILPEGSVRAALILMIIIVLGLALWMVSSPPMRRRRRIQRILILGTSRMAWKLTDEIEARPQCRYAVIAVVDGGMETSQRPPGGLRLASLDDLRTIMEAAHPDRVIVALPERRRHLPTHQLMQFWLRGVVVEEGAEVYERLTGKLAVESLTPSVLIRSKEFTPSRVHLALGRTMSLLVAVVGLAGLAPLMGLIALAIKLDSTGPVVFLQERVGLGGKPFKLIKFRTMQPVSRPISEWVRDNGDRITRVGKWLRKYRLDELPQFVNILRGDMNLVGPRPHPASNYELLAVLLRNTPECGEQIPYYSLRCSVRPGLTGWAQVRYRYANNVEEEIEKMRYDLYYIKHLSFWLDLRILLETVKTVLLGRGAGDDDPSRAGGPEDRMEQRLNLVSRMRRQAGIFPLLKD
ncbi:MAG TPA: sugar transferase [Candidatus Methylomirabilis sp.]|nr:sugar transferase [Candidatus Methylomirabilis sp.]